MNRYYKGSDIIINVCKKLKQEHDIEFILMEREPHNKIMEEKYNCDITSSDQTVHSLFSKISKID